MSGKEKMMVMKREEEEEEEDEGSEQEDKRKKGVLGSGSGKKGSVGGGGGGSGMRCCQAEKCTADLSDAKQYHRRHKVCEIHAKAQVVLVSGIRQRFCQQCSRLATSNSYLFHNFLFYFILIWALLLLHGLFVIVFVGV